MASFDQIIQAGQTPSPLIRGLNEVARGVGAIQQGRQRVAQQEQLNNQRRAYEKASMAFLDTSDKDATNQYLMEAIEADPKTAFIIIESMKRDGDVGAAEAFFNRQLSGLSEEDQKNAVMINLGLKPRAVGSAAQTIASTGSTTDIARSEAEIAGAKEGAKVTSKAEAKARSAPLIAKTEAEIQTAIQQEKAAAKSRGETESELKAAKAALPSLIGVVENLKSLAPIATSTYSGRAFDAIARETGFGATEGAEARAKFIAIIDNQVLPLLKQTFGAAFTVQEGENLKRTMGDPNASPEEKIAQLNAFIENKVREIEVKERELSQPAAGVPFSGTTDGGLSESALKYLEQ